MANHQTKKLHIAMFPWLAFGHIMPYLELAKLIALKGHKISFISTPGNIARLPKLSPNLSHLITFVKLPLPHVENLPLGAEATGDLPENRVWYLKKAYDLLEEPLSQFLQSSLPDWILYDFAAYWAPDVARRLNISAAWYSIFIASCICYVVSPGGSEEEEYRTSLEDFTVSPKWINFPSNIAYRRFEFLKMSANISGDDDNVSDIYRFRQVVKGSDLIAVRSSLEMEPEYFKLLESIHQKPVVPVGVLPSWTDNNVGDEKEDETWKSMKQWLDNKASGSVVYVAFGSEAKPSQTELNEIALGLELSGVPFFWVLKTRRGSHDNEVLELPDGFEERTEGRGLVCTSWAPQVKILAHDSVGGFLTHSGWSSVVESLQFSKALLLLTFFSDQAFNAKLLESKKIGYLVPRSEDDGSFTREAVAESVRLVIVEEEGKPYRDKAKVMSSVFGDRARQDKYVEGFLECLQSFRVDTKEG